MSDAVLQNVFVVCEGQTEETFIRNVIAPTFYLLGISLITQLIETSPGHKGGALKYERVQRHLRNNLRRPAQPFVTTLIDLYKLDNKFPGYAKAKGKLLPQRLLDLNAAFHEDVVAVSGCRPDRFLPYIQPYEFEALLFSDVTELTRHQPNWTRAASALQIVRDAAESPEHINDNPTTKPAAHLERYLTNPHYRKLLHGPTIAEKITLTKIESECPFFREWLQRLRTLTLPPTGRQL